MKENSYINSPIQSKTFNGKTIYIKRDDLLHKDFSGNKARKFYHYLINDFPNIKKVVSHGSAQSNAMYSLSVLAKLKGWQFDYYVDHVASYLKENPQGNYKAAFENGMNIHEETLPFSFGDKTLFIPEGGALKEAQVGIRLLAQEITSWAKLNSMKNLKVFLPSGTGTTALYLQKYLPFQVLTCACVGDEGYLKKQFIALEKNSHPCVLPRKKKYHFGKLYHELYAMHLRLKEELDIEFDLLYDSLGFMVLEEYIQMLDNNLETDILYIHQGGILGNPSMLARYEKKYSKI